MNWGRTLWIMRIVCPVMAFGHEPNQALIAEVLQLAKRSLEGL